MAEVDIMKAFFGLFVDDSKFDEGIERAERRAEQASDKISGTFNTMAVGIATGIAVTVVAAIEKAIEKTVQWASEMENLSGRMGMTAREASTLIGVMERYGMGAETASRAMGMLAMEIRQTNEAMDPYATRLGRLLGPMRDVEGNTLSMGQVFDLARQKVSGAESEMQKLQIAQQLVGQRMGGRFLEVLRLNSKEWDNVKKSVEGTGIVTSAELAKMGQEYEKTMNELNQSVRGIQVSLGAQLLPAVIDLIRPISEVLQSFTKWSQVHPELTKLIGVLALFGAPLIAIIGGVALATRGWQFFVDLARRAGVELNILSKTLGNINAALGQESAAQMGAAKATDTHTGAIRRQSVAMKERQAVNTLQDPSAMFRQQQEATSGFNVLGGYGGAAGVAKFLGQAGVVLAVAGLAREVGLTIRETFETEITYAFTKLKEMVGLEKSGAAQRYLEFVESQKQVKEAEGRAAGRAEAKSAAEAKEEQRWDKLLKVEQERAQLMEKAESLGIVSAGQRKEAAASEMRVIEARRAQLEGELGKGGLGEGQRIKIESEILQLKIQEAQITAKEANKEYAEEEKQLRAVGAFHIQNQLEVLQRKLADERIVGDERLKIEEQVYQKRREFTEEAIKVGRQMGVVTAEQEIGYRRSRAQEELGKGNVVGAAQEIQKAKELAMQQADAVMDFMKKIRIVSLSDEIEYQKQKLNLVKGNADEEMKVLSAIADLDKQLYDKRLQFAVNYTQNIQSQYKAVMDAAKSAGETMTYEQQRIESGRQLREATREAGGVLRGGGTGEQLGAATKFAQFVFQQTEEMAKMGKDLSSDWKDALAVSKEILKRATGEQVRAPGEISPVIGSLTSPAEGLATSNLARGSEIPRLDTSFADLAIRVRDVLLGTIPNLQNFSNALADATRKMSGTTPPGINIPPGIQFGTPLATGAGTPAQPGFGPTALSTTPVTGNEPPEIVIERALGRLQERLGTLPESLAAAIRETGTQQREALQAALASARLGEGRVVVEFDENTGQFTGKFVENTIEKAITQ